MRVLILFIILVTGPIIGHCEEVSNDDAIASVGEVEYRVTNTDFETVLRPDPDSLRAITRIPPNSKVRVLDKKSIQEGVAKVNWYLVVYEDYEGWVSGMNFQGEENEATYSVKYTSRYKSSGGLPFIGNLGGGPVDDATIAYDPG